jgi:hypothetical protein
MPSRLSQPATLNQLFAAAALALVSLASSAAQADEEARSRPLTSLSTGFRFTEQTGEDLFASACQG